MGDRSPVGPDSTPDLQLVRNLPIGTLISTFPRATLEGRAARQHCVLLVLMAVYDGATSEVGLAVVIAPGCGVGGQRCHKV